MADIRKLQGYFIKDTSARIGVSDVSSRLDNYVLKAGDIMSGSLVSQTIVPQTDNTYDLGTNTSTYKKAYINTINCSTATALISMSSPAFIETSDINKKNIIGDIDLEKAYELIDKCSTIIYTLIDDPEQKEQIGTIAQEVQEFFPELVFQQEDGSLMLSYSRLTIIIMRVLKDLIDRVKKIEIE